MSELNLIMLGPPAPAREPRPRGSREDFGLPYIATGDMLRAHVKDGHRARQAGQEHMDARRLVPDELVIKMISERIAQEDAKDGFMLDGFPRNVAQADALDEMLDAHGRRLSAVLLIDVPRRRGRPALSGRRVCVKAGHTYHVEFDPPKREGVCDQDGSRLEQRDDDKPETIRKPARASTTRTTEPLDRVLRRAGLLRRFDGTRSPTEVHDHIRATLATLRLEERL